MISLPYPLVESNLLTRTTTALSRSLNRANRTLGRLVTLVLLGSLMTAACDRAGNPLDRARAAFGRGDLNAARVDAATAVQKNEHDAEAHLLLGTILSAQGDLSIAERTLRRAAVLGMERARVDPVLARVLLRTAQYQVILDQVVPTNEHRGDVLGVVLGARGRAYLAMRDLERAQVEIDTALQAAPHLPDALIGRAQLAYMRKDPDRAMQIIDQILLRHPRDAETLTMKAQLLVLAGRAEAAIAAYGEASKADPANLTLDLATAELLMDTKRFREARNRIDTVRSRAPEYMPGRYADAHWHFVQGGYDKALEVAQLARKTAPSFEPLVQLIAIIHLARGNPNQAEEELRGLVHAHPQNFYIRKLYATTLLRQGKPKAALASITEVLQARPDDVAGLRLAADAYAALRDYTRATQALEHAARLVPENGTLQAQLGMLRVADGDFTRGLRVLEDAVAASTDTIGADVGLALLHLERRAFDKVLDVASGIQRKQPKNPIGFYLAGLAQVATAQTAVAVEAFDHALELDGRYWPAAKALARIDEIASQPQRARGRIEALLTRDPANVEAHYALFHFTGDRGRLLAALESARRVDAKALAPRLLLARELTASGVSAEALAVASEAVAIAPADPSAQLALGSAQLAANLKSEALETFRRMTSERSGSAVAHLRHAQTQAAMGETNGAEAAFKKVLVLRPHDPEATEGLAKLLMRSNRADEALQLAHGLRSQWPKSGVGDALLADLLLSQKKAAEALVAYDQAFARSPSGALLIRRHRVGVELGKDPGLASLAAWLSAHPRDAEVRLYLGNRLYAEGKYELAAIEFFRIVEADPKHAYAFNNLASAYLKRGDDTRALKAAQAAYALLPDDADVLDTLGVALVRTGKAEEGAQAIKKALGRRPDVVEYHVHFAVALAKAGDRAAGRAVVEALSGRGSPPVLDAEARQVLGLP